ncbi:MAG: hypothetical protein H0X43_14220 [Nitrosospira sp.]|nr:hypothetical protein [Nitrosospira sp.]
MNTNTTSAISACLLAVSFFSIGAVAADGNQNTSPPPAVISSDDRAALDKLIREWPPRPQLAAQQMLAKYGAPQEVSSERLVWHNQGRYKRIMVTKLEIPHDFPKPHMDYLQHTIDYRVPSEKANSLIAYDGSVTIDRTAGEMSARCDLEGHNILTLNLAHDIITGKKDVEQARRAFGQNVVDDVLGKYPPYTTSLQFEPGKASYLDPDKPVIPGSPKRAAKNNAGKNGSDSEIIAFVIAVDDNQILSAMEAAKKKLGEQVKEYARMLHKEHGKNLVETMKLGQKMASEA